MSVSPLVVQVTTIPATMTTFLSGHIRFLRERGFEVVGVTSPGPELATARERLGIELVGLPMVRGLSPVGDALAILRLALRLRRLRPAIVHAHTPKGALVGMSAAFLARVPVRVYTIHGLIMESGRGKSRRLMAAVERLICGLATRVHAVSASVRRVVVEEGLCPADKIKVLGRGSIDGVDAARFYRDAVDAGEVAALRERGGLPAGAEVIGFVGRVVRDKGVAELVAAFEELARERPGLRLVLAGRFEDEDPLPPETMQTILGDNRVYYLGWTDDPRPAYRLMDVLALPSYREGFGNVCLEAGAMGLPVVACRVTGLVDAVVDGETGLLVPPRDARALAGALRRLLDDPTLREGMGRSGRERALRDFAPSALHQALLDEYRELLSGG